MEHVARKNRGFVLRAIKGKGFGICATRDFVKGKLVPMGRDVLVCRAEGESSAQVWERTSYQNKLAFLALANQTDLSTSVRRTAIGAEEADASVEELDSIFDTNCYARDHGDVIYRMGSRFNHSCQPNCEIEDGSDVEETYLRIHRNIQEGEEMVVTYLSDEIMAADLTARRNYLFESWGFHCECVKCTKQAAKTECTCQVCSNPGTAASAPTLPSGARGDAQRQSPTACWMTSGDGNSLKRTDLIPRGANKREDKDRSFLHEQSSAPPCGDEAPDVSEDHLNAAEGNSSEKVPLRASQLPTLCDCEEASERQSPPDVCAPPGPERAARDRGKAASGAPLRGPTATKGHKQTSSSALAWRRAAWSKAGEVTKVHGEPRGRPSTAGSRFSHIRSRLFDMTAAGRAKMKPKECGEGSIGPPQSVAAEGERDEVGPTSGGDETERKQGARSTQKMPRSRQQLMLGQSSLGIEERYQAGAAWPSSMHRQAPLSTGQRVSTAPSLVLVKSGREATNSVVETAPLVASFAQSLRIRANREIWSARSKTLGHVPCTARQNRLTDALLSLDAFEPAQCACPARFAALIHRPHARFG